MGLCPDCLKLGEVRSSLHRVCDRCEKKYIRRIRTRGGPGNDDSEKAELILLIFGLSILVCGLIIVLIW